VSAARSPATGGVEVQPGDKLHGGAKIMEGPSTLAALHGPIPVWLTGIVAVLESQTGIAYSIEDWSQKSLVAC